MIGFEVLLAIAGARVLVEQARRSSPRRR